MEALLQMGGYIVSVLAAAGIVAGIEALNGRCADGPSPRSKPVAIPVSSRSAIGSGGLRQSRS